jgi:hypothetical protein
MDLPCSGARHGLGWRHFLPIVQTLFYCALTWWGLRERFLTRQVMGWEPQAEFVLIQEGTVHWDPRYTDGPLPLCIKVAVALNLSAVVPALLILLPIGMSSLDLSSFASELLAAVSIGLFVPFVGTVSAG